MDRPGRHIDHIGLQGIASLKKVTIVIWRFEQEKDAKDPEWKRIAVMRPTEKGKSPIVPLVVSGKHYLPLVKETSKGGFPVSWVQHTEDEGIWFSTGVQNEVIENSPPMISAAAFRGSGSKASPSKSTRSNSSLRLDLLATPVSKKSRASSVKSFQDVELHIPWLSVWELLRKICLLPRGL